jgi:restriction system protein
VSKTRDEITHTQRTKTERRAMYAQLICAATVATLHDIFTAGTTGQVDAITFNGYASGLDSGTGNMVRACVISARCTRQAFEVLNLAQVDPVECLEHLGGRVSRNPAEYQSVNPYVAVQPSVR